MSGRSFLVAWAAAAVLSAAAEEPAPKDFAWRATLDTAGRVGLVRAPVPAEALARLQARSGADLRVFDAQGRPVPFSVTAPAPPAQPPRQETASFRALPLYTASPGARPPQGTVAVRIDEGAQGRSLWVQLSPERGAPAPQVRRLPAAVFDTRAQQDPVTGLVVRGSMPANVPVRFTVSTSPDLASWTPAAAQGRIFRFEGEGAPANDRLEFAAPLPLQDRYLRLDWSGHEGVAVEAVAGLLRPAPPQPALPAVALASPRADGPAALEWSLGFATPIRQLDLSTAGANTLVPLRVLGRNVPSEPWRVLAHAVVYRLGAPGDESTSSPIELGRPSVRWLRVEATHGARLEGVPLQARVVFDPVQVVFVAGAAAPYQLAAGRAATAATALPVGMLSATTRTRVEDLPVAGVTGMQAESVAPGWWAQWLPHGMDGRTAGLWLVLGVGVVVLGGVAWSLVRQLNGGAR